MTTILTVHGTGSTGPEQGEKWWQKGSPFEAQMRDMVQADEGELNWQPVIWDGANSETSRRAAGKELYQNMLALETRGEPYSLIGHSHGGSVISAALIEAAGGRNKLEHMKSWLTVGTPFIKTKKEKRLFTRLGLVGKTVYIALLMSFFMFLIIFIAGSDIYYLVMNNEELDFGNDQLYVELVRLILFPIILILPLVTIYYTIVYLEVRKNYLYQRKSLDFASRTFPQRWLSLWHLSDEAVQGLKSLKSLKIDIFSKSFVVTPISSVSILLMPSLLLVVANSPDIMRTIEGIFNNTEYGINLRNSGIGLNDNGNMLLDNISYLFGVMAGSVILVANSYGYFMDKISHSAIIAFFLFTTIGLILSFISLLVFVSMNFLSKIVSAFISRLLNPLTRSQIQAMAFGSDTEIDDAVDAQSWPMWLDKGHAPLPEVLANNLQAHSDAAAAKAIPKFRSAAAKFAMATDDEAKTDMLSDYLTWDELIHTSYFKNAYFCKLVAYGLAQGEGFSATQAFRQDPHYANAAAWHSEITGAGNE